MLGVDGVVYGVIAEEMGGEEYPAALDASTDTVYDVPFVRPVIVPCREYPLLIKYVPIALPPLVSLYEYLYPRIVFPPLDADALNDKSMR